MSNEVIISLVAVLPATLLALATLVTAWRTGARVDGRLTQLLEQTALAKKAEGAVEGKQIERAERAEDAKAAVANAAPVEPAK